MTVEEIAEKEAKIAKVQAKIDVLKSKVAE
jgi:hypothetical protein